MRASFSCFAVVVCLAVAVANAAEGPTSPRSKDARLVVELFASEPDIVTPTGIAADAQGHVLAIENHTHFRPKDYDGPPADRIRRFEDTNGDGRADRITTYYEGSRDTMSLASCADGSVLVATRNEVFRLRDTDGDGTADQRTDLVRMESNDKYPHSGIAGFAFDPSGDIYFGLGENHAMPFRLIGSDGAVLTSIEGGHVYRCRSDGSGLSRVAIGCWNPHALAMDTAGRLFAVDNDPDSLPPCRLLHVVVGADFGYKYRNGRKGTHPFTAWNGELPDTLPMVTGTGEAPSGMWVCGRGDRLPEDYRGDLLVTSWGDHRIERYRLAHRGASVSAERIDVVTGGEDFRPVGIALGGDGALYFTDWVDKNYELHKKGRIWRLRTVRAEDAPRGQAVPKLPAFEIAKSDAELRADVLRSAQGSIESETLWKACNDDDPFIRLAAREGLKRIMAVTHSTKLTGRSAHERLAILCILRDINDEAAIARLPEVLSDSDSGIRLVALKWIGEERLTSHRSAIDRVLSAGPITSRLFAAYIAAQEALDGHQRRASDEWSHEQYVAAALTAKATPPVARRWALRTLRPSHDSITEVRLREWLASDDEEMRLEAVRTLRESRVDEREARLLELAEDANLPIQTRCEAVVGIASGTKVMAARLVALACGVDRSIGDEALRSLRGTEIATDDREKLLGLAHESPAVAELVARVIEPTTPQAFPRADDIDSWMTLLEGPADAAAGERIFFHAKSAACSRCHQVDGRGGTIGPDLSTIGRTLDRRRLVESIVRPSKEIAPQYVTWSIETTAGRVLNGILLGETVDGRERYVDANAHEFVLGRDDVESRETTVVSMMPEGLVHQMTPQEFRDLLAYLVHQ